MNIEIKFIKNRALNVIPFQLPITCKIKEVQMIFISIISHTIFTNNDDKCLNAIILN